MINGLKLGTEPPFIFSLRIQLMFRRKKLLLVCGAWQCAGVKGAIHHSSAHRRNWYQRTHNEVETAMSA
jgi:hypothetical protein